VRNEYFIECEKEWEPYLLTERADAFLWLMLPVAMQKHHDITCDAPITEMLLHNINAYLVPLRAKYDHRLYAPTIICETESENIGGDAVGTGLSLGVDTMWTIRQYYDSQYSRLKLTHFYIGNVAIDVLRHKCENLAEYLDKNKPLFESYERVASELDRPLLKTFSNFFELAYRQNKMEHNWNHFYLTMAEVLCFRKLWRGYLFSSSYDFGHFSLVDNSQHDTAYYELLQTFCLTLPDFYCFSSGGGVEKIDKTRLLLDFDLAQREVHPCFSLDGKNCSKPTCSKCSKMLITADYYDKLDNISKVFDIDAYKRNRMEHMVEMAKNKDNVLIKQIYPLFCEKEPETIKRAEQILKLRQAPVARNVHNELLKWYKFTQKLLLLDNPKKLICDYFLGLNVSRIAFVGGSNIGNTIAEILRGTENITIVEQYDDADIILCLSTSEAKRRTEISTVKAAGTTLPVVTLEALSDYCTKCAMKQ
jgi:hypothetical protein